MQVLERLTTAFTRVSSVAHGETNTHTHKDRHTQTHTDGDTDAHIAHLYLPRAAYHEGCLGPARKDLCYA